MHWFIAPRIIKIFYERRELLEVKLEKIEKFREEIERFEKKIEILSSQSQKESSSLLRDAEKECDKLFKEEEIALEKNMANSMEAFSRKLDLQRKSIEQEISKKQKDFLNLILQKLLKTPSDEFPSEDRP